MMFSDVLLTVDFDRTLTAPDSTIPQRNLDAIQFFTQNGGAFTMNTGRSVATFWKYLDTLPVNAPFLLYNGSAAYEKGELSLLRPIDLDVWQTMDTMRRLFPEMNLEIQGTRVHHLVDTTPEMVALYEAMQWRYEHAVRGSQIEPFIKFALFGNPTEPTVANMFTGTPEELHRFDEAEETIRRLYGDKVEVFRAAPRIIDVHAKGVSKDNAARALQKKLGRKILVCVGDARNDISMLDGADYAYCPSDAELADRYENVCDCASGAVADVIYKKIPEILGINLDIVE
ncbi:MAG: HAD-IIB family hydrolase [Oscillospiraceae bacterium]|nr:HAD-IIB family hydrolase [Oscillospiraceae bacterium]